MSLHHSSIPKGIHELDVILNQLNYHDRIQYAYNLGKKYSQSSELSNLLSDIFKMDSNLFYSFYHLHLFAIQAASVSVAHRDLISQYLLTCPLMYTKYAVKAYMDLEDNDKKVYEVILKSRPFLQKAIIKYCIRTRRTDTLHECMLSDQISFDLKQNIIHGCSSDSIRQFIENLNFTSKEIPLYKTIFRNNPSIILDKIESCLRETSEDKRSLLWFTINSFFSSFSKHNLQSILSNFKQTERLIKLIIEYPSRSKDSNEAIYSSLLNNPALYSKKNQQFIAETLKSNNINDLPILRDVLSNMTSFYPFMIVLELAFKSLDEKSQLGLNINKLRNLFINLKLNEVKKIVSLMYENSYIDVFPVVFNHINGISKVKSSLESELLDLLLHSLNHLDEKNHKCLETTNWSILYKVKSLNTWFQAVSPFIKKISYPCISNFTSHADFALKELKKMKASYKIDGADYVEYQCKSKVDLFKKFESADELNQEIKQFESSFLNFLEEVIDTYQDEVLKNFDQSPLFDLPHGKAIELIYNKLVKKNIQSFVEKNIHIVCDVLLSLSSNKVRSIILADLLELKLSKTKMMIIYPFFDIKQNRKTLESLSNRNKDEERLEGLVILIKSTILSNDPHEFALTFNYLKKKLSCDFPKTTSSALSELSLSLDLIEKMLIEGEKKDIDLFFSSINEIIDNLSVSESFYEFHHQLYTILYKILSCIQIKKLSPMIHDIASFAVSSFYKLYTATNLRIEIESCFLPVLDEIKGNNTYGLAFSETYFNVLNELLSETIPDWKDYPYVYLSLFNVIKKEAFKVPLFKEFILKEMNKQDYYDVEKSTTGSSARRIKRRYNVGSQSPLLYIFNNAKFIENIEKEPLFNDILTFLMFKTKYSSDVFSHYFYLRTKNCKTSLEKRMIRTNIVESLLKESDSSIHYSLVWGHLLRNDQKKLEKFISTPSTFSGIYTFVDDETDASFNRRIKNNDHNNYWLLPASYQLNRLLPKQSKMVFERYENAIFNDFRSLPNVKKCAIRMTLLPTSNYKDLYHIAMKVMSKETQRTKTIAECLIQGFRYSSGLDKVKLLLSPDLLNSSLAKASIYTLKMTMIDYGVNDIFKHLLEYIGSERFSSSAITIKKEVMRILFDNPSPIVFEFIRKQLGENIHKDVFIEIIKGFFRILESKSIIKNDIWTEIENFTKNKHLEVILNILLQGNPHNARLDLFDDPIFKTNESTDIRNEEDKEIYVNRILLKIFIENDYSDVKFYSLAKIISHITYIKKENMNKFIERLSSLTHCYIDTDYRTSQMNFSLEERRFKYIIESLNCIINSRIEHNVSKSDDHDINIVYEFLLNIVTTLSNKYTESKLSKDIFNMNFCINLIQLCIRQFSLYKNNDHRLEDAIHVIEKDHADDFILPILEYKVRRCNEINSAIHYIHKICTISCEHPLLMPLSQSKELFYILKSNFSKNMQSVLIEKLLQGTFEKSEDSSLSLLPPFKLTLSSIIIAYLKLENYVQENELHINGVITWLKNTFDSFKNTLLAEQFNDDIKNLLSHYSRTNKYTKFLRSLFETLFKDDESIKNYLPNIIDSFDVIPPTLNKATLKGIYKYLITEGDINHLSSFTKHLFYDKKKNAPIDILKSLLKNDSSVGIKMNDDIYIQLASYIMNMSLESIYDDEMDEYFTFIMNHFIIKSYYLPLCNSLSLTPWFTFIMNHLENYLAKRKYDYVVKVITGFMNGKFKQFLPSQDQKSMDRTLEQYIDIIHHKIAIQLLNNFGEKFTWTSEMKDIYTQLLTHKYSDIRNETLIISVSFFK